MWQASLRTLADTSPSLANRFSTQLRRRQGAPRERERARAPFTEERGRSGGSTDNLCCAAHTAIRRFPRGTPAREWEGASAAERLCAVYKQAAHAPAAARNRSRRRRLLTTVACRR